MSDMNSERSSEMWLQNQRYTLVAISKELELLAIDKLRMVEAFDGNLALFSNEKAKNAMKIGHVLTKGQQAADTQLIYTYFGCQCVSVGCHLTQASSCQDVDICK